MTTCEHCARRLPEPLRPAMTWPTCMMFSRPTTSIMESPTSETYPKSRPHAQSQGHCHMQNTQSQGHIWNVPKVEVIATSESHGQSSETYPKSMSLSHLKQAQSQGHCHIWNKPKVMVTVTKSRSAIKNIPTVKVSDTSAKYPVSVTVISEMYPVKQGSLTHLECGQSQGHSQIWIVSQGQHYCQCQCILHSCINGNNTEDFSSPKALSYRANSDMSQEDLALFYFSPCRQFIIQTMLNQHLMTALTVPESELNPMSWKTNVERHFQHFLSTNGIFCPFTKNGHSSTHLQTHMHTHPRHT